MSLTTEQRALYALSGRQIASLMRKHGKTIREIAKHNNVTMKRVREVREKGVTGGFAEDWHWMITGAWPTVADLRVRLTACLTRRPR
jgi:hypothetical protein